LPTLESRDPSLRYILFANF
jgi:ATP synthase F1 beta subunit